MSSHSFKFNQQGHTRTKRQIEKKQNKKTPRCSFPLIATRVSKVHWLHHLSLTICYILFRKCSLMRTLTSNCPLHACESFWFNTAMWHLCIYLETHWVQLKLRSYSCQLNTAHTFLCHIISPAALHISCNMTAPLLQSWKQPALSALLQTALCSYSHTNSTAGSNGWLND